MHDPKSSFLTFMVTNSDKKLVYAKQRMCTLNYIKNNNNNNEMK